MPTYLFKNPDTGKEYKLFMKISERDQYVIDNPTHEQLVYGFPADADSFRIGRTKPADGFKDLLGQIKKNSGRKANINTFK